MDSGSTLAMLSATERERAVNKAQELEFANKEALTQYINVVKATLFQPEDLSDMLAAAPVSIELLGTCFISSTSRLTAGLVLKPRVGGYIHMKNASLNANLLQCTHIGTKAFMIADRKLRDITVICINMFKQVDRVLAALNDDIGIKKFLAYEMRVLKEGAEMCQSKASEIEKAFEGWSLFVAELKEVIMETSVEVMQREKENHNKQVSLEEAKRAANEIVDEWRGDVQKRREEVEKYDRMFQKTLDDFPSSSDLTKAFITQAITDAAASALQAVTASYTAGPMAWLGNSPAQDVKNKDKIKSYQDSHVEEKGATTHVYDTAYSDAVLLAAPLRALRSYLFGNEGQPDWPQVTKPNLEVQEGLVDRIHSGVKRTGTEASNTLLSIIQKTQDLLRELKDFINKSAKSPGQEVKATPEQTKEWQGKITEACEQVFSLASVPRTQPGSASIPRPEQAAGNSPSGISTSGSLSELLVTSAAQKLEWERTNLESARTVLVQSVENLSNYREKLGDIMADLAKLRAENATLNAAYSVLNKCGEVLATLSQKLRRLVLFFEGIVSLTEDGSGRVKSFVNTLTTITDPDPSISTKDLIHYQRWNIVTHTVMSRAYFTVLREVSVMYTEISSKHIMPGLDLLDDLSINPVLGDGDATQILTDQKKRALEEFAKASQRGVFEVVNRKYSSLVGDIDQLLQKNASDRDLLPTLVSDRKAITSGADEVTVERLNDKKEYKPPLLNPITIKFE